MITAKELKELVSYDPETGDFFSRVRRHRLAPGDKCGSSDAHGYIVLIIHRTHYKAHRLAWLYMTGTWPEGQVDHKNLVKSDNRFENLRVASRSQNQHNKPRYRNNTSGFKGVYRHTQNGNWVARIKVGQKRLHIGSFATPEEAARAYQEAAKAHFGQFARAA